jgi:Zn-dependent peptidase ImmA (M78 family)/DNA-binding XRE family transcriptional regulator
MSEIWPERITQARELAGLNKTELADKLEVTVAAITQWENGVKHPIAANSAAISRELQFPMPLLFRPIPAGLSIKGPLSFRSWSSAATRRANRKAMRFAELVAEGFLWLDEKISFPKKHIPEIDSSDLDSEKTIEAATICRREWGLGDRPILKLGELFESKGIVLSSTTFDDGRFDAFSCIINRRPFIFLGEDKKDMARARFNAAHEYGHLALHQHYSDEDFLDPEIHKRVEAEANLFASAFLMPKDLFKFDVIDISLNGFLKQKPKWGASVQAMVRWSYDLGLITQSQYGELFHQMGAKGWRRPQGEPLDDMVPEITGTLGRKSLEVLQANNVVNSWEIASELPFPSDILRGIFQGKPDLFEPTNIVRFEPTIVK